jgi:hypothetical protein
VSLNTLMNQIVKNHLDWHRYASQGRLYHFPRPAMSRIIDKLTDEELSEVAVAVAKKDFVDLALLRGKISISFYLYTIENWLRVSALPYKHEVDDDEHNFIIEHRMGNNFSFFLKEYNSNILDMLEIKSDFNITDNIIAFKFKMPESLKK